MHQILVKPTVGQMIEALQQPPADTPFRMEDADTEWPITVIHIELREDGLWLFGLYHEMHS